MLLHGHVDDAKWIIYDEFMYLHLSLRAYMRRSYTRVCMYVYMDGCMDAYCMHMVTNAYSGVVSSGNSHQLLARQVCMHVWMDGWMYVCMYVSMYVCLYVCKYVCMHVCMNVCM